MSIAASMSSAPVTTRCCGPRNCCQTACLRAEVCSAFEPVITELLAWRVRVPDTARVIALVPVDFSRDAADHNHKRGFCLVLTTVLTYCSYYVRMYLSITMVLLSPSHLNLRTARYRQAAIEKPR